MTFKAPDARPTELERLCHHRICCCRRGTSGFVVLATDMTTGQQLAIKFISRGRQHVDVNMKEISRELLVRRGGPPCSCAAGCCTTGFGALPAVSHPRGAACWMGVHDAS